MVEFPKKINAGDSFFFSFTHPLYPIDSGWIANYIAVGPTKINLQSITDGMNYTFIATKEETAQWIAGEYKSTLYIVSETERHTILSQPLLVMPNLDTLVGDARTHVQKVLDALNAVLEERATTDQENMTLNGRSLARTPIGDLLKLRTFYMRELEREKRAQMLIENWGGLRPNKIRVRL